MRTMGENWIWRKLVRAVEGELVWELGRPLVRNFRREQWVYRVGWGAAWPKPVRRVHLRPFFRHSGSN